MRPKADRSVLRIAAQAATVVALLATPALAREAAIPMEALRIAGLRAPAACQSGDPESPHYRDLAPLWRDGRCFPLAYTRKAVEHATERVIRLVPARWRGT